MEGDLFDLGELEENNFPKEDIGLSFDFPSESNLIPKVGSYLGLDISEGSTGICLYENGEKIRANISLTTPENDTFREVKARRELKTYLSELIEGKQLDLIIIEDAFQGVNPKTTRLLYALNTAIDEMILDGICTCEKFKRVSNKEWKGWLFKIDSEGKFKGLNDKIRIQECLNILGVTEEGEGFQDRLDACGILLGYFLCQSEILEKEAKKKKKRVSFEDVDFDYQPDEDLALEYVRKERSCINKIIIQDKRVTKTKILDYLSENPDCVHITNDLVLIGNLGMQLDLPCLQEGGYFSFWVKTKKLKKYVKE